MNEFSINLSDLPVPTYTARDVATSNKSFIQHVLGWRFNTLSRELEEASFSPEIPLRGTSIARYYESFKPLVLEEARAAVAQGAEKRSRSFEIVLIKDAVEPRHSGDCWSMDVRGSIPRNEEHSFSMNVLLLKQRSMRGQGMAIVALASEIFGKPELKVKFMLPSCYGKGESFKSKAKWDATYLTSLVSQQRIFETCITQPDPDCLYQIIEAKLPELPDHCDAVVAQGIETLNESQQRAVQGFLALTEGIAVTQGPPGTGKSAMITALLNQLYIQKKRTLVSGPSNKAVQVLAERFLANNANACVILTGVEGKVPAHLKSIFLHTWREDLVNLFNSIDSLSSLLLIGKEAFLSQLSSVESNVSIVQERTLRYNFQDYITFDGVIKCLQYLREEATSFKLDETIDQEEALNQLNVHLAKGLKKLKILKNLADHNLFFQMNKERFERELLDRSSMIFSTLAVSGRPAMLSIYSVEVAIVDEAGQCVEAETVNLLHHLPEKILFVGDPKQLPATVISQLAKEKGYGRSIMERFAQNGQPFSFLNIQYRMDPEICVWPSHQYYGGQLVTDPALERNLSTGLTQPIAFYDINLGKEGLSGTSHRNDREAAYVMECIRKLRETDLQSRIGVITFYSAQVDAIQQFLMKCENPLVRENVTVNSVDGFQGDEREIIILSCVRANEKDEIGFLQDPRRWNVALTRAKRTLIILGNAQTLKSQESDLKSLIDDLQLRGKFFSEDTLDTYLGLETKPLISAPVEEGTYRIAPSLDWSMRGARISHSISSPTLVDRDWRSRSRADEGALKPSWKSMNKIGEFTEQVLCRFFKSGAPGSCRNGEGCRFLHEE